MVGLLDDLAEPRLDRPENAVAVDQAEQARDAEPEARVRAHPLSIARQQIVHQLADHRAERGPVERLRDRAGQPRHDSLVPPVAARQLERRGERRGQGPVEKKIAQPRHQIARRLRRQLGREPAGQLARGRIEVARAEPLGRAGDQGRDVHAGDFLRDVLLGEHTASDHRADARGHQLPVGRDERGMRDRQAERPAEDRRDRKPVGEPADDARLGDRQDPAAPPRPADGKDRHGQGGGRQQHAERESALTPGSAPPHGANWARPSRALTARCPSDWIARLGPGGPSPRAALRLALPEGLGAAARRSHLAWLERRRRDGRRIRFCLTSQTPRGDSRTTGRKSAERKNSV